ncbi:hypothetical protein M0805_000336 [Coniferiporia weirii]|nr:hypothetical protein M0805_000336 [Coniferiporia weirii]
MAFAPLDPGPPVRSLSPLALEHPFSIQEFGDLVSSALDVQRVPDNALALSFGIPTPSPPRRRPRSRRAQDTHYCPPGPFMRLRGVFVKKAVPLRTSPPATHKTRQLASSSAHALPQHAPSRLQTSHPSASLSSLGIHNLKVTQKASRTTLSSYPATFTGPAPPAHVTPGHKVQRAQPVEHIHSGDPQTERSKPNHRSFLNLKPLTIPKLAKKSSKMLFSAGSPLTPLTHQTLPSIAPHVPGLDLSQGDSEGMRSFFDDSGYRDGILIAAKTTRKKSRPNLRSLFQTSPFTNTRLDTQMDSTSQIQGWNNKALPLTPPMEEKILPSHPYRNLQVPYASVEKGSVQLGLLEGYGSTPYDPRMERKTTDTHRPPTYEPKSARGPPARYHEHEKLDRVTRPPHQISRKIKARSRCSPSPYPSPTSPLPPTPELSPVGLPTVSPPNSDHYHTLDYEDVNDKDEGSSNRSIDSVEILSWRMPALEQLPSKTPTASSTFYGNIGSSSRDSIRRRLGLEPRLQLHIPLPAQTWIPSRSITRDKAATPRTSRAGSRVLSRLAVRPASGIFSSSTKSPISRLASASFVSLRSIATMTAGNNLNSDEELDGDRRDALEVDRAFTPDDDPFAAHTPVSPLSWTHTPNEDSKYRSVMPQEDNSSASIIAPDTPTPITAILPRWKSQFNAHYGLPSPILTPLSSTRSTAQSLTGEKGYTAIPSSACSELPLQSLTNGIGPQQRTPPSPTFLHSSRRHSLVSALSMAKITQGELSPGKARKSCEGNKRIVGHTTSRPNSPFPLLFLRSHAKKTVSVSVNEKDDPSSATSVKRGTDGYPDAATLLMTPLNSACKLLLMRRSQELVRGPLPLSTIETDVFGDACSNNKANVLGEISQEVVSPTAYLLESNEYNDILDSPIEKNVYGIETGITGCEIRCSDLSAEGNHQVTHPSNDPLMFRQCEGNRFDQENTAVSRRDFVETESETEISIEYNRSEFQGWPLPPHRTVVVDRVSGEGWHIVEPIVEYVQPDGTFPDGPRHSIRSTAGISDSASTQSRSRGSVSSGTSQKLNTAQARLIAEKLGYTTNRSRSSLDVPAKSQRIPYQHLRRRAQSTASLHSVGDRSNRTCKSAYYTVRSSASRGSDQSTSSIHSRPFATLSREGSFCSATSLLRPASDTSSKSSRKRQGGNSDHSNVAFPGIESQPFQRETVGCIEGTDATSPIPNRNTLSASPPGNALIIVA